MIFYFVIFTICTAMLLFDNKEIANKTLSIRITSNRIVKVSSLRIGMLISLLILVLVNGLRYDVGTDQLWYINGILPAAISGNDIAKAEGFSFFVRIMYQIIPDTHSIYIIISTALIVLFYICFYQNSAMPRLSIVLWLLFGLYNVSFNIMRQMLATAIAFYAIKYIKEKKFIKFAVVILLAASMHYVAIAYIFLYFLPYVNLRKNKKTIIVLFLVVILKNQVIQVLYDLASFVGTYQAYFGGRYYGEGVSWSMVFVTVIPLAIYTIFDRVTYSDKSLNETSNLYYNISVIQVLFALLYSLIPNADRFIFMFLGVHCLYVPHLLTYNIKSKKKGQIIGAVFIMIALVFWIYYFGILNCGETIPYKIQ